MDFTIFGVELTATQASDDYTNLTQIASDVERVGALPWLWTKDGDNIVDNCDDSTRDNWAVAGGVPGSLPSETEIRGNRNQTWFNANATIVSLLSLDFVPAVDKDIFIDLSGTADVALACGDANEQTTVTTSAVSLKASLNATHNALEIYQGKEVYGFVRLKDAGSNLSIATVVNRSGTSLISDYKSITTLTSYLFYRALPVNVPRLPPIAAETDTQGISFTIYAKRSSGSAAVNADYFCLLARPLIYLGPEDTASFNSFLYSSRYPMAKVAYSADNLSYDELLFTGDILELEPERYNVLISFVGDPGAGASLSATLTYTIRITPRYALL